MSNRTTHSDLAVLLRDHAKRPARVPAGYLVNDGASMQLIDDAARILTNLDQRIEDATEALRDARDALTDGMNGPKRTAALIRINKCLGTK